MHFADDDVAAAPSPPATPCGAPRVVREKELASTPSPPTTPLVLSTSTSAQSLASDEAHHPAPHAPPDSLAVRRSASLPSHLCGAAHHPAAPLPSPPRPWPCGPPLLLPDAALGPAPQSPALLSHSPSLCLSISPRSPFGGSAGSLADASPGAESRPHPSAAGAAHGAAHGTASPARPPRPGFEKLQSDDSFWDSFHGLDDVIGRGCFGSVLLVRPREAGAAREAPASREEAGRAGGECSGGGEGQAREGQAREGRAREGRAREGRAREGTYAVKVQALSGSPEATRDCYREAAMLSRAQHAGVARLHVVYESPSAMFLLMEAYEGGDLRTRAAAMGGGVLPVPETRHHARRLMRAVRHVHSLGICHRDIKPANILLTSPRGSARFGEVALADFGLAVEMPADGTLLTSVCGTEYYLAPEMIRSGHGDADGYGVSIDVWAVGLTLYALLYGATPFERETDIETIHAILEGWLDFPRGRGGYGADTQQTCRPEEAEDRAEAEAKGGAGGGAKGVADEGVAPVDPEPYVDYARSHAEANTLIASLLVDSARRPTAEQACALPWLHV